MTVYTPYRITVDGGDVINKDTIDWKAFYPNALRVICSYYVATFGHETAEDLAQETLIKLWRRLDAGAEFPNARAMWAYLNLCATSVRTDYYRHAATKLRNQTPLSVFGTGQGPGMPAVYDDYANDGSDASLRAFIATLPDDQRLAVALMEQGLKPMDMMQRYPHYWPTLSKAYDVSRAVRGRIERSTPYRAYCQEVA